MLSPSPSPSPSSPFFLPNTFNMNTLSKEKQSPKGRRLGKKREEMLMMIVIVIMIMLS